MKTLMFIPALILTVFSVGGGSAQSDDRRNFLFKQCDEYVLGLRLDPEPLREYVGPKFPLTLQDGKALVAIIVQDCSQYWIDGENLGPNKMAHVWVQIEGPKNIRPVVGAELTVPTMTWFNLSAGSTNPRDSEARKKSGTSPTRIEDVVLELSEPNRGGKVDFADGLAYSWKVSSERADAPLGRMIGSARVVGVNHVVYDRNSDGRVVVKRIQGLVNVAGSPNKGMLNVVGGTDPSHVVGSGTYPIVVYTFLPVWARVTLGEAPPGMVGTDH